MNNKIIPPIAILFLVLLAGSAAAYPPAAILKINGNEQISGIGDNCWKEENQTSFVCSDTFDKITPTEPLLTNSPFMAHLLLPLQESPEEVSFITTQVTDDNELKSGGNGARLWRFEWEEGNWHKLPLECKSDINLSLAPGLYVLNVFVKWEEKGNVLYGFLVQVNDQEAKYINNVSGEKIAGFEFFPAITILLLVITIRQNRIK